MNCGIEIIVVPSFRSARGVMSDAFTYRGAERGRQGLGRGFYRNEPRTDNKEREGTHLHVAGNVGNVRTVRGNAGRSLAAWRGCSD
ncbi:hypothetical protein J6590_006101 [Homalodisca vitripennis]|nr:hypothetical protein J6590_006101 [Homalodisca vitripennis]